MIYFFTGNTSYGVNNQVDAWKKKFVDKFGDFNFLHFKTLGDYDLNFISENLFSGPFMGDKKLLIINLQDVSKDGVSEIQSNFLIENLSRIPEDNIILFYSVGPDKRTKLYKTLKKETQFKEFDIKQDEIIPLFNSKYTGKIDPQALHLLATYKSYHIEKIDSEIQKMLIFHDKITKSLVEENIFPELEESIFILVDDILAHNIPAAISRIHIILQDTNTYAFYNNLIANIRTSYFISKLKSERFPATKISDILGLGNRTFLVNKSFRLTHERLESFYLHLIELDKKMKSGKFVDSDDNAFIFELERCVMSI